MKRQRIQQIATLVVLSVALAAGVSCTGTDFNDSGTAQVAFEATAVNPGSQGYECVLLRILELQLQPIDPSASQVLGSSSFAAISNNIIVNFSGETCSLPSNLIPNLTLTEGAYRITKFVIGIESQTESMARLFDQQSGTSLSCRGFQGDTRDFAPSFPDPIIVREGVPIRLVVDVQELEEVLRPDNQFFVCQDFFDNIANILEFQ